MTRGQGQHRDVARVLGVDFREARRRIESLKQHSTTVRGNALAAYVAAFDLADADGFVKATTETICDRFEISLPSWNRYRSVLEEAGLLEVEARRGGLPRGFRLLPPL